MSHHHSKLWLLSLFVFLLTSSIWGRPRQEVLDPSKIQRFKSQPCTLIHVWAAWCEICLREMPEFLELLKKMDGLHPVLIDISSIGVQKGFSRKWMRQLNPPFTVYFKPPGNDERFLSLVDKEWQGSLPYTALYHRGKRIRVWLGSINFGKMKKDLDQGCKK